ncbi:MAG: phosphoadenosine phosphosulfate reductase family protein, partial [Bacteroidota bacterium]
SGLRREQAVTRENINLVEYDENFSIIKINPLFNWTEKEVWDYINKNNIPYNQLYKENYRSIGCAPCTRPVKEGGTVRDGRWWWENADTKECGLHIKPIPAPSLREG